MPIYIYKCPACGATKEIAKPMSESDSPELCDEDGFVMNRDLHAEQCGTKDTPGNWPQHSDAAGVAESQIVEASREMARAGCPTEFDSQGRAVFRDRAHRKKALRAIGMFDRNAGFSDPEPVNL